MFASLANHARKHSFRMQIQRNVFQTRKVKFETSPKKRNGTFYHVWLMSKSCQKRQFFQILDKKEYFLEIKSSLLPCGFFWADQGKKDRFLIFWIEKKTFQSRKVKFQKHPKNRIFQVHGFCQKIELFTMCVFWQPKEEKIAFYYSGQKRILLRPVSKTSEKSNFSSPWFLSKN